MKVSMVDYGEHLTKVLIDHDELELLIKKHVVWSHELPFNDYSVIERIEFQTVVENNAKLGTQCEVWIKNNES